MSDFFIRLAERATGKSLTVHPLFSSRYSSEMEAQRFTDASTESRMGVDQTPIESSNSNALGRPQPSYGSPVAELPQDDQGQSIKFNPTSTDSNYIRIPLASGSPSIDLEESHGVASHGVASTMNRQTAFGEDSTRNMSSTKPSNMPTDRPAVLPVPTTFDPSRRVAMGEVEHRDSQAGMPVHHAPALTAPKQFAFHSDKPLPSPTPTRSITAKQVLLATATVGDVGDRVTPHATEETAREEIIEQRPVEPTAQFDGTTVPARMDTDRSDAGPPVVRVTIGRIEVRAILPVVQSNRARPTRTQPVISLDEYLKQGKGAVR